MEDTEEEGSSVDGEEGPLSRPLPVRGERSRVAGGVGMQGERGDGAGSPAEARLRILLRATLVAGARSGLIPARLVCIGAVLRFGGLRERGGGTSVERGLAGSPTRRPSAWLDGSWCAQHRPDAWPLRRCASGDDRETMVRIEVHVGRL